MPRFATSQAKHISGPHPGGGLFTSFIAVKSGSSTGFCSSPFTLEFEFSIQAWSAICQNSSFIFQDSRVYLIIVAIGDDHSAVNDLSLPSSICRKYCCVWHMDTSIAYQTTNFIDVWPSRINTMQLYAYWRQEPSALSFIFIRFMFVSGLAPSYMIAIDRYQELFEQFLSHRYIIFSEHLPYIRLPSIWHQAIVFVASYLMS